jgi:hypothetical protein
MMKHQRSKKNRSLSRGRSWPVIVLVTVFLAVAVVTIASRQVGRRKGTQEIRLQGAVAARSGRNYVTVRVAGQNVQVDPETGQIKPLTPQEAKQLADGLKVMLNRSSKGLVQKRHPDGSVAMDLEGRFQNVAVARINEDGSVTQSCIDNPQAAASFFGIDPQLLGVEPGKTEPVNQPARVRPVDIPIR